ncbi:glycosyltransferase [Aerococcaceae bacterium WGS1372]
MIEGETMNILFYIGSAFPNGSAWAIRGQNLAKLFEKLGYNVHIISRFTLDEEYEKGKVNKFDGIDYEAISNKDSRLSRFYSHITDLQVIKSYILNNDVDIFFTSSVPMMYKPLKKFLDKMNIPLYIEQCEWFDSKNFKLGKYDPNYRKMIASINNEFHKSSGIVAISSFLENHYKKLGANVIRIPTILNVNNIDFEIIKPFNPNKIKLIFAGNIGGQKELLGPIFEAISIVQNDIEIEFNIFGPTKAQVIDNIEMDEEIFNKISKSINMRGRVPQTVILEEVKKSDYMIFMRPERRSSEAGFPTKLAESFSVGTPVISNATGDINKYLINDYNGFLLNTPNPDALVDVLYKISEMKEDKYIQSRKKARLTAEKYFDYNVYTQNMKELLED